jgi:hypothetical protein
MSESNCNRPPENRARIQERDVHDDGVDVTLIRWMLSLTPAERLRVLQGNLRAILRMHDARCRERLPILRRTLVEREREA